MRIFDRYVVLLFGKIFLICFASLAGLYVVIDLFANLEEFFELTNRRGGMLAVFVPYYGPRILQFFDRTAPLMALAAAIFTFLLMQRAHESVAIQAGGISYRRMARPVLIATLAIAILSIVNRECWIPPVARQLTLNMQDLANAREHSIKFTVDHRTGIVINGQFVQPTEQLIGAPEFLLPETLRDFGDTITAESGRFLAARGSRPSGYLLDNVQRAVALQPASSQFLDGRPAILRPADNDWLKSNQIFVVTDIDTHQLAFGAELVRLGPLWQMIRQCRLPSATFLNRQRVDLHGRIVQPVFDLSLVLVGLPLVLIRGERNLFFAAGICLITVLGMLLAQICFQALGASRIVNPPALAVWIPLFLFVPLAAVTLRKLDS